MMAKRTDREQWQRELSSAARQATNKYKGNEI